MTNSGKWDAYFDSFSRGRSSGGASKTTVGIGADAEEVEADAAEAPSAAEAVDVALSFGVEADPDDLIESLRCRLLDRDPEPLFAESR